MPSRSPGAANDQGQLRGEGLGPRGLLGPHWPWWKFLGKGGPAECPRLLGVGVEVGEAQRVGTYSQAPQGSGDLR